MREDDGRDAVGPGVVDGKDQESGEMPAGSRCALIQVVARLEQGAGEDGFADMPGERLDLGHEIGPDDQLLKKGIDELEQDRRKKNSAAEQDLAGLFGRGMMADGGQAAVVKGVIYGMKRQKAAYG